MVGFLKSLQAAVGSLFADLPEGVKVVTEFLWKVRWFLLVGWVCWMVYQMVMVALPYLLISYGIKMVLGSVFSVFSSL
jgi:hypothetical protein